MGTKPPSGPGPGPGRQAGSLPHEPALSPESPVFESLSDVPAVLPPTAPARPDRESAAAKPSHETTPPRGLREEARRLLRMWVAALSEGALTPAREAEALDLAEAILCKRYHSALLDAMRHEQFETPAYARAKEQIRKVAHEVTGRFKLGSIKAESESRPPDNPGTAALLAALHAVPSPGPEIVVLRLNNMTWAKIAQRLEIDVSHAQSLYNTSIAELLRCLHPRRNE